MARFTLAALAVEFHELARSMPERRTDALRAAAEFVEEDVKARFGTYQKGWPELAEATQADRVQQGYPADEPLLRSGELRDSYGHQVEGDRAHIGSNDPRASWVETGTARMPPRPVLQGALAQKGDEIVSKAAEAYFGKLELRRRG